MSHSQPVKILIGLLTAALVVAPFFLVVFAMLFSFLPALPLLAGESEPPEAFFLLFAALPLVLVPAALCLNLLIFGLQIFYTVQILKNRQLSDTPRILFTLGTFFIPYLTMPIYYFTHLLKDAPPAAS